MLMIYDDCDSDDGDDDEEADNDGQYYQTGENVGKAWFQVDVLSRENEDRCKIS